MRLYIIIFLTLFFGAFNVLMVDAQIYRADFENFKRNNADGNKYEFVKDFLLALDSFKRNENNYQRWADILDSPEGDKKSQLKHYIDHLKQANIHFRVAKNLLNKHEKSRNGLILKSVQIFKIACDEIVDWNNQERALMSAYYDALLEEKEDRLDKVKLQGDQENIVYKRKDSYRKIAESAMYIQKILISNVPNRYGEFTRLGITDKEREKLIKRIEGGFGNEHKDGIEVGQTFLEASVATIREVLEDYTWPSLDS